MIRFVLVVVLLLTVISCSDNDDPPSQLEPSNSPVAVITPSISTVAVDPTPTAEQTPTVVEPVIELDHPLAVYLWEGEYPRDTNFLEDPLPVAGYVNDPRASVTVNGNPVTVGNDGSFASSVQLANGTTVIEAVATLGQHTDSWIMQEMVDNGALIAIPGMGSGTHWYEEKVDILPVIPLVVGEEKVISFDLKSGKQLPPRSATEFSIWVDDTPNLTFDVFPNNFIEYPNTTYTLNATLLATESGSYPVILHYEGANVGKINIRIEAREEK